MESNLAHASSLVLEGLGVAANAILDGELWMNRGRVPARQVFADPRGSAFVLE
jgi:hypothetical protein